MSKFFTFIQNNSYGRFDFDKRQGITHIVIVEAPTYKDANFRAESIGLYFDGVATGLDCPCCGDRWYQKYDERDGEDVPMYYNTPVDENCVIDFKWMGENPEIFVHYLDGTIKAFS